MQTNNTTTSARPRWSTRTSFHAAAILLLLTVLIVMIFGDESGSASLLVVFIKAVLSVSLLCFLFLSVVLYKGVRFQGDGVYGVLYKPLDDFDELREVSPGIAAGYFGPVGCLFGLVFNVLWSLFFWLIAAALLWFSINAALLAISALFFPCYFVFQRSIRYITARGNACRSNFKMSALYAAWFSFIWGLWLLTMLFGVRYLSLHFN